MGLSQREAQKTTSPWNHLSRPTPTIPVRSHHPRDTPGHNSAAPKGKSPYSSTAADSVSCLPRSRSQHFNPIPWIKNGSIFIQRNTTQQKNKRREGEARIRATLWTDPQSCWAQEARHEGRQVYYSVCLSVVWNSNRPIMRTKWENTLKYLTPNLKYTGCPQWYYNEKYATT